MVAAAHAAGGRVRFVVRELAWDATGERLVVSCRAVIDERSNSSNKSSKSTKARRSQRRANAKGSNKSKKQQRRGSGSDGDTPKSDSRRGAGDRKRGRKRGARQWEELGAGSGDGDDDDSEASSSDDENSSPASTTSGPATVAERCVFGCGLSLGGVGAHALCLSPTDAWQLQAKELPSCTLCARALSLSSLCEAHCEVHS